MPATGTLEDLGKMVQAKYPAYQSLDPSQVGKLIQAKYPGAYDSFAPGQQSANADDPGAPDAPQATAAPVSAPQPAAPVGPIPGPGAGSPSASGFGIQSVTPPPALTPPPGYRQGLFTANEFNRRAAKQFDVETDTSARGEEARQSKQFDIAAARADIERSIQALKDENIWDKLSPRQRADVRMGSKNITPERTPITIKGYQKAEDILKGDPTALDALGQPLQKGDFIVTRVAPDGLTREYYPVAGGTTKRNIIDPQSGKGYLVTYDRSGTEIHREETIDPRMLPSQSSNSGVAMVTQQIEDPVTHRLVMVQVPTPHSASTVTQRVVPGQTAAPVAAPGRPALVAPPGSGTGTAGTPGTPASASTVPAGSPAGTRVIGTPRAQQKMDVENPLTGPAQAIVMKVKPQVATLMRLQKALEPYKDKSSPMTTLMPRIAYAMGFASSKAGVDEMLSNLEMTNITAAASALSGSTRAGQFVERAMLHTPNAWKDSGKLQYEKVSQIVKRLQDMLDVAQGPEGQRNPGLVRPPSTQGATRPPLDSFHK